MVGLRSTLAALLVAGTVFSPTLAAPPTAELAIKFGAREEFYGVALSPDGTMVSYLNPIARKTNVLMVVELATGVPKPILKAGTNDSQISGCSWAKIDRLMCRVGIVAKRAGYLTSNSSLLAVDPDGENIRLFEHMGFLDKLPDDPDNILLANGPLTITYVVRENIRTGKNPTTIDTIRASYLVATDPQNQARIKWVYDIRETASNDFTQDFSQTKSTQGKRIKFSYRTKVSKDWLPLGEADLSKNQQFSSLGFDETGDWIYILKPKDGRLALFRFAADGSNREETILARPNVDVDGIRRIGKYDRPVGVVYTDDYEQISYFDNELGALATRLQRALPGKPPVSVLDETWDGKKLLLYAGSDVDPGAYYLFDKTTKRLSKLSDVRPALAGVRLAEQRPVTYPARDGTSIPGYLTLPPGLDPRNLPIIIMPHGGPAARDTRGFDWLSQYFAQLGYAVLQPNYRGSSGYGDAWFNQNGFKGWRTSIGDINDGAHWLVSQGIADPTRLAIFGWSYGGYAALQANVVEPGLYKATVAVAPVTDLDKLRKDGIGNTNYNLQAEFIGSGPEASAGSPAQHALAFRSPVLMFHGTVDLNVNISQSKAMKSALDAAGKPNELIIYPDLEHSLVDSGVRADMLLRSARFLEANLK